MQLTSASDFKKFEKQIDKTAPTKPAIETFGEGRLAAEYAANGFVIVVDKK